MIKYVLCFLLLYLPLEHSSETFKESYKNLKPTPKKVPVNFEAHGVKRVDNYYWMRDDSRENPEVINHLNSCLLYTSPSPRDATLSRMPSSA